MRSRNEVMTPDVTGADFVTCGGGPPGDQNGDLFRWLVENFTKDGQSTGLYMLCQVNMTLTADPNAARRFRRQRTAEFRAMDMREARGGDWRAVEHGFDDSKTPNVGGNRLAPTQE